MPLSTPRNPIGVVAACALLTGCAHLGPTSIPVDRFDYSSAIADSWKQQTLLNIVKLRYMDLPVFVDVASIVAGYSLQTGVAVNGVVSSAGAVQGNYGALAGQAVYTDRPTITYAPLTGEKFLRGLVTPIDPKNIFFMLQSGYPADFLLSLTIESINGLHNRSSAGGSVRAVDPEFTRVVQLMREVQAAGAIGMRIEDDKARGATAIVFFRQDDIPTEVTAKLAEIRRLLRVPADAQRLELIYSPARGASNELTVSSRSMLQIIGAFASYIDVPAAHLSDGSATGAPDAGAGDAPAPRVRIRSDVRKPEGAFAAVSYRGHWFWIDESDWQTKRALTAVVFFFTLADTGGNDRLPLITIPAQ